MAGFPEDQIACAFLEHLWLHVCDRGVVCDVREAVQEGSVGTVYALLYLVTHLVMTSRCAITPLSSSRLGAYEPAMLMTSFARVDCFFSYVSCRSTNASLSFFKSLVVKKQPF